MSDTKMRYRATCSCGYRGRWFVNGNDAAAAEDNHNFRLMPENGGRHDGRRHFTSVEEMEIAR